MAKASKALKPPATDRPQVTTMVQTEANLLAKAAELCLRMDQTYAQARAANMPEPDKATVVHIAANAAMDAQELLAGLVGRWLRTL